MFFDGAQTANQGGVLERDLYPHTLSGYRGTVRLWCSNEFSYADKGGEFCAEKGSYAAGDRKDTGWGGDREYTGSGGLLLSGISGFSGYTGRRTLFKKRE